jgi:hypothetical protein
MSSYQDTRAAGILRVAELAVTRFEGARDDPLPVELVTLRVAIDQAKRDPEASDNVERVRAILMSVPELEALLREEFPEGARPRPFTNMDIRHLR